MYAFVDVIVCMDVDLCVRILYIGYSCTSVHLYSYRHGVGTFVYLVLLCFVVIVCLFVFLLFECVYKGVIMCVCSCLNERVINYT